MSQATGIVTGIANGIALGISSGGAGLGPLPSNVYVAEDGTTPYITEDGTSYYVQSPISPQTAQVIVYGLTPAGITAAIEAKRQGATVLLVGGWRDVNIGGMPCGGLGHTDISVQSTCTGLAHTFIAGCNGGSFDFRSSQATASFNSMLTNAGIAPVYTTGVTSVSKTGANINNFTTVDGYQFNGTYFIDASYEADLMALAGIEYNARRDAKDAVTDAADGFTGAQSLIFNGTSQHVDPYVTPGNSSSGTISGVNPGNPALTYPAIGAQDSNIQGYCFRMTLQYKASGANSSFFVALPNTPPAGYDITLYEPLLRFLDTMTTNGNVYGTTPGYDLSYFFSKAPLDGASCYDFNNGPNSTSIFTIDMPPPGPYSTDLGYMLGGSAEYINGTYARREQIWEAHQAWILGLLYMVQYAQDARIPAAMTTDWLRIGYDSREFTNPKTGDPTHFPYQLYVRCGRRMVGDFVLHANDLTQANGNTPRSIKTVAQGSYKIDSHNDQFFISSGFVKMEGYIGVATGGANNYFPIPYEVTLPKRANCTNMYGLFCLSASSEAFNAMRMEVPMMEMGQAAGCAAAIGIAAGGAVAVQDIDYPTLRTKLLAEGMVLPQVT